MKIGRLEEPVTWKALLFLLSTFALFQLGITIKGLMYSEARAADLGLTQATKIERVEAQVAFNKQAADAGLTEARKDIQALYQYMLTRQRQPRLEKDKDQ